MSKQQVWMVLGKLPLEDKVIWIQGGSDWGEGTDAYLLKHGYSVSLFWDFTDYANYYSNLNWVTGQPWPWARPERTEGIYKRTWLDHEGRNRIEF